VKLYVLGLPGVGGRSREVVTPPLTWWLAPHVSTGQEPFPLTTALPEQAYMRDLQGSLAIAGARKYSALCGWSKITERFAPYNALIHG
jgi:hypothetical protein